MRGRTGKGRKAKKRTKSAKSPRGRTVRARTASRKAKSPTRKKSLARKKSERKSQSRKPAARKARTSSRRGRKDVLGEGNYTASREFRKDETAFIRRNRDRIPAMGEEAEAALEGNEGAALRPAEDRARSRSHSPGDER
jgi:hypothetical protein